ncbi:MAG: hypothetical protein EHM45_01735 [Desulfobacteraceae bacterium]|nr:MAG: hypothetical protein EHM45_01735 [Desulfobacteraceae bacterium]
MNNVVKYLHEQNRIYEWYGYSFSYFEAAECLVKACSSNVRTYNILFSPLIYNLHHGIELMLKFFSYALGEKRRVLLHHDISTIFIKVRSELLSLDDETLLFASKGLEIDKSIVRQYIQIIIEKIGKITIKYWSYQFLSVAIQDSKNELFRYPSNTTGGPFSAVDCPKPPLREISEDIGDLISFLLFFVAAFGQKMNGSHVLDE